VPLDWPDPSYPEVGGQPEGVNNLSDILQYWHSNPGNKYVNQFIPGGTFASPTLPNPDKDLYPLFDAYLCAVVQAGKNSPALLMWDAMNEPQIAGDYDDNVQAFVQETLRIIKAEDPDTDTIVGFQSVSPALDAGAAETESQAPWRNLDVIGTQLYAVTRVRGEAVTWSAYNEWLDDHNHRKPIVAIETGGQGFEQYAIDYMTGVPRVDRTGPGTDEKGMGFVLYQAIVGLRGSKHPHNRATGLFFWNGNVRSIEDATALYSASLGLATNILKDPIYFVQPPRNSIFGYHNPVYYDEANLVEADAYEQLLEMFDPQLNPYSTWTGSEPVQLHSERFRLAWITVQHAQIEDSPLLPPWLGKPYTHLAATFHGVSSFSHDNFRDEGKDVSDAIDDLHEHFYPDPLNPKPPLTFTQQRVALELIQSKMKQFIEQGTPNAIGTYY
jgi:hypothetical protein